MSAREMQRVELERLPLNLTIDEAAELLRVSDDTIWRLIRRRELEVRHVGRKPVIPRASVIVFLLGDDPDERPPLPTSVMIRSTESD